MIRRSLILCSFLLFCGASALCDEREDAWRVQIRKNFFIDGPLPELKAETHRRFEPAEGVTAEAISYATQHGTRVPAILYIPRPLPAGKIPAFIVVNGHGGDKYSWYAYYSGILYARAGAAVLTYDQAGEGDRNAERKSGTRDHDRLSVDAEIGRRQAGLMITDVIQAVSYLSSRPEVDPKRIAAAGYSLGSFVLSLAGAVETRLHAAVLVGGGNLDGPGEYWDKSKSMCQGFPYQSLMFLGDRPAVIYALHAARGPTLVYNGTADSVVNMDKTGAPFMDDLRARTIKLRGKDDGVFETGFVEGISHRPFFVTRPVAIWLHRQLRFPNWTEEKILALPETRIGTWAEANDVPMDKLYATETREGGTPALGNNVPGYRREDLSVMPPAEWERRKSEFIIESWHAAALAEKAKAAGR